MNVEFNFLFNIEIKSSKLKELLGIFKLLINQIFSEFVKVVLLKFAEERMNGIGKTFSCEDCGESHDFIWKTRHGKKTKIITELGNIEIEQLQVQCKKCGNKFFITRQLLGMEKNKRISLETIKKLGLMGALASFRVIEKIAGVFGAVFNRMTVWNCVQKTGKVIQFDLDPDELPEGEADGTGVPVHGAGKRGMEMKIFTQKKKDGKIRIAGVSIGKYHGGWDKLFQPLITSFKKFKSFLITTDGDTEIFKGLGNKIKVLIQRCLWHMGHQMKYCLWQDKVPRKSDDWILILGKVINICSVSSLAKQTAEESIPEVIKQRKVEWNKLLEYCNSKDYKACTSYLKNAEKDLFTAIKNRFLGRTTSKTERLMRTLNTRVNVGKWSPMGVLNAVKIRLAYYYNGFDA